MKYQKPIIAAAVITTLGTLAIVRSFTPNEQESMVQSRGIGVYPGAPSEYFGPGQREGGDSLRNLALKRAAWHSSSYDYNLTAQLATDGITTEEMPLYMDVSTSASGSLEKRDRERIFDHNKVTTITIPGGKDAYIQVDCSNYQMEFDMIDIYGTAQCNTPRGKSGYVITFEGSNDHGKSWKFISSSISKTLPGYQQEGTENSDEGRKKRAFSLDSRSFGTQRYASVRVILDCQDVDSWTIQRMEFSLNKKPVEIIPSFKDLSSAWMSQSGKDEWIYVDLGADARISSVRLSWISRPQAGRIEVSDDLENWQQIGSLPSAGALSEEIALEGQGRYFRLSGLTMADPSDHVILSEMEVWGTGGVVNEPHPALEASGNRLYLSGGDWKLERSSQVNATGEALSQTGYPDGSWTIATVPATIASSYYNAGAIPDIRYDDDQLQISESYFYSDFWYRDEFTLPEDFASGSQVLNFDGINWKSEVYVNGAYVGRIDGAFKRGSFDVSSLLKAGRNALAVRIIKNDHPGIVKEQTAITADLNGGVLGADHPTMHCAIGWDWIPTVRGRNTGIWNDVWIGHYEKSLNIEDVFLETTMSIPDTTSAVLTPIVTVRNLSDKARQSQIRLTVAGLEFKLDVEVQALSTEDIYLPSQVLHNPRLWWPKGYGEPYLYDMHTEVLEEGILSDSRSQKAGIRKMTYTHPDGRLDLYINGRRLICNGGNWGYPEINLNYRGREYDIAVAYHADMNYTMIRDWVGQTGDEEFYEACDRHGVMIWQDFWLANPWDGPDPDDEAMFLDNARDYVRRIRNHPSLALYCGRNEGYPPENIDKGLRSLIKELHSDIEYIPHSAEGPVSGNGPYNALAVKEYFSLERGRDRLHSERGMPNVMNVESIRRMLRKEHQWPQNTLWGIHDYTMENAQKCASFNQIITTAFGESQSLEEFASRAQWINYNGYRAMYESRSPERKGLLIWMSHSCWPSMVWQSYDYYFAPTAAYFGIKKGSAPIRIQFNPLTENVEVVNNSFGDQRGLTARIQVLTYLGEVLYENSRDLDIGDDSTLAVEPIHASDIEGLTDTYYIKLSLEKDGQVLADNFYWEGLKEGDYTQLLGLDKAEVSMFTDLRQKDGEYLMEVRLDNRSDVPALMLRLDLVGSTTLEQILPVFYEDNYVSLMPGQKKTLTVRFKMEDTRGEKPKMLLSGFNL